MGTIMSEEGDFRRFLGENGQDNEWEEDIRGRKFLEIFWPSYMEA